MRGFVFNHGTSHDKSQQTHSSRPSAQTAAETAALSGFIVNAQEKGHRMGKECEHEFCPKRAHYGVSNKGPFWVSCVRRVVKTAVACLRTQTPSLLHNRWCSLCSSSLFTLFTFRTTGVGRLRSIATCSLCFCRTGIIFVSVSNRLKTSMTCRISQPPGRWSLCGRCGLVHYVGMRVVPCPIVEHTSAISVG